MNEKLLFERNLRYGESTDIWKIASLCYFCCRKQCVWVTLIKTFISSHIKKIEMKFSILFTNLPNEDIFQMLHLLLLLLEQCDIKRQKFTSQFSTKIFAELVYGLKKRLLQLVSAANDPLLPFEFTSLSMSFPVMSSHYNQVSSK